MVGGLVGLPPDTLAPPADDVEEAAPAAAAAEQPLGPHEVDTLAGDELVFKTR